MQLSPDCVRAILLTIESAPLDTYLTLDVLNENIPDFTLEEIEYCCRKLYESECIELVLVPILGKMRREIKHIKGMTYKGHELLEKIKSDTVWGKTKKILKKAGSVSISLISDIASSVATEMIKKYL